MISALPPALDGVVRAVEVEDIDIDRLRGRAEKFDIGDGATEDAEKSAVG